MACKARDGRACLQDDIWPYADRPVWNNNDHTSLTCWCPVGKHDRPKLIISAGDFKRIVWHCNVSRFAGQGPRSHVHSVDGVYVVDTQSRAYLRPLSTLWTRAL